MEQFHFVPSDREVIPGEVPALCQTISATSGSWVWVQIRSQELPRTFGFTQNPPARGRELHISSWTPLFSNFIFLFLIFDCWVPFLQEQVAPEGLSGPGLWISRWFTPAWLPLAVTQRLQSFRAVSILSCYTLLVPPERGWILWVISLTSPGIICGSRMSAG